MKRFDSPRTPLSQGILSDTKFFNSQGEKEQDGRYLRFPIKTSPYLDEDLQGAPRRATPSISKISPTHPKLVTELSLSDFEHESISFSLTDKRRRPKVTQKVVVVETNFDNIQQGGEVETRAFTMQSPAKVICHSPSLDGIVPNQSLPANKTAKSLSFNEKNGGDGSHKSSVKETSAEKTIKESATKTVKKKKRFVPVQSRYRQQKHKKDDSKSCSLEISAIAPHPTNQTSCRVRKNSNDRVTSTPFLMTSAYEKNHPCDGSLFDQTKIQQTTEQQHLKESSRKEPVIKEALQKMNKQNSQARLKKKVSNKDLLQDAKANEPDQFILDLHYARLLHMTYLERKAKHTFEKQEKKGKKDMYALWVVNRKLEKDIETLTLSVQRQKLEIAIDQLLNIQLDGLKPLHGKLSKLILTSSKLSETLSNTTHCLPIVNITLGKEEKMLKSLDESKRLLADIQALTRNNQAEVKELGTVTSVLLKTVKSEISEEGRCAELLAACTTLINQERSLQVQLLQRSR